MNISMKSRSQCLTAFLVTVAASASAAGGPQDFKDEVLSTRSRTEVLTELSNVLVNGQLEQRGGTTGSFGPHEIASTSTRAEVIADLQLWRESGMADVSRGDLGYYVFSARYREALERYLALRASPRYAQLVQKIAAQRGEVAARGPVATSAQ